MKTAVGVWRRYLKPVSPFGAGKRGYAGNQQCAHGEVVGDVSGWMQDLKSEYRSEDIECYGSGDYLQVMKEGAYIASRGFYLVQCGFNPF